MGKVIDLTGMKFCRWSVVGYSHQVGKMLYWNCVCDCGAKRAVFGGDLKRGGSRSCGCLMKEEKAASKKTHGMIGHPAYASWRQMRQRCHNPHNSGYYLYGGRGISVDPSWEAFEVFWADMGATWKKGSTIDRIDNDKGYSKGNCRWSTPQQQAHNRRSNTIIMTPIGAMNVTQASKAFGLKTVTVTSRIRYGWPEDRLLEPPRKSSRTYPPKAP
jgi:hypothetical protein